MRRSLRGPSLMIEADNVVRIRFLKVTTFVLAFVALFSAGCAALADGRHHREVLRCTRHASRSRTRLEDNDCVLTATPRGVDRFFEKRSRSSFEIAGAEAGKLRGVEEMERPPRAPPPPPPPSSAPARSARAPTGDR